MFVLIEDVWLLELNKSDQCSAICFNVKDLCYIYTGSPTFEIYELISNPQPNQKIRFQVVKSQASVEIELYREFEGGLALKPLKFECQISKGTGNSALSRLVDFYNNGSKQLDSLKRENEDMKILLEQIIGDKESYQQEILEKVSLIIQERNYKIANLEEKLSGYESVGVDD